MSEEANWNVAELRVCQEQKRLVVKTTYAAGGFTYDDAREIVALAIAHLVPVHESVQCILDWRAAREELDVAQGNYCWSLYQHGATPREGLDVVFDRLIPHLKSSVIIEQ